MALFYRSDAAQVYENVLKKNEGQSLKFTFTFFEKPNNIDPTSLRIQLSDSRTQLRKVRVRNPRQNSQLIRDPRSF